MEGQWEHSPSQREQQHGHTSLCLTFTNMAAASRMSSGQDVQSTSSTRKLATTPHPGLALRGWWFSKHAAQTACTRADSSSTSSSPPEGEMSREGYLEEGSGACQSSVRPLWLYHTLKAELSPSKHFRSQPRAGARH